jgi:hypothetical protein
VVIHTGWWITGRRGLCGRCLIIRAAIATIVSPFLALLALAASVVAWLWPRQPVEALAHATGQITQSRTNARASESSVTTLPNDVAAQPRPSEPQNATPPQRVTPEVAPVARHMSSLIVENERPPSSGDELQITAPVTTDSTTPADLRPAAPDAAVTSPHLPRVTIETTVTATVLSRHAAPTRPFALPAVPHAMRSYMAGKCLTLSATVDEVGEPAAEIRDYGGVHAFYAERALAQVRRRWNPALTADGHVTSESLAVKFQW